MPDWATAHRQARDLRRDLRRSAALAFLPKIVPAFSRAVATSIKVRFFQCPGKNRSHGCDAAPPCIPRRRTQNGVIIHRRPPVLGKNRERVMTLRQALGTVAILVAPLFGRDVS